MFKIKNQSINAKKAVKKILIDRQITPVRIDTNLSMCASSLMTVSSKESETSQFQQKKRRTKTYNAACRLNFTNGSLDMNTDTYRKNFGAEKPTHTLRARKMPTTFGMKRAPVLRFSDNNVMP